MRELITADTSKLDGRLFLTADQWAALAAEAPKLPVPVLRSALVGMGLGGKDVRTARKPWLVERVTAEANAILAPQGWPAGTETWATLA